MKNGQYVVLALYEVHMASAAIMIDGDVIAAAHEERFTRLKNDVGFPLQAALFCMKTAGISPADVDAVGLLNEYFDEKGIANILLKRMALYERDDWLKELHEFWYPKLILNQNDTSSYFDIMGGWDNVPKNHYYDTARLDMSADGERLKGLFNELRLSAVENHLGIPRDRVTFMPHYLCHHYHAYYSGPLRGSNVVIAHAEGDGGRYNQAVSIPSDRGLKVIAGTNQFNLGRLYQWMTLYLGMKPYGHEYKVMGLAPYASSHERERSFKAFAPFFETDTDELVIRFGDKPADLFFTFQKLLEGHRFDGIAGGLQQLVENHLIAWLSAVVKKTGRTNVAYGGGVAMNIKANMHLSEIEGMETLFVPLSPADESNVFGAAYWLTEKHFLETGRDPDSIPALPHAYWGQAFNSRDAKAALDTIDTSMFHIHENPTVDQIAGMLADGQVVARSRGREEFGQRSLGNRSIMANPSYPGTVGKINHQIKNRDFWMPFAPSILTEHSDRYLSNPKNLKSPFMTIGFRTNASDNAAIMQALHPADLTARPQIVESETSPEYHRLIDTFRQKTGIGAVLNTSFNLHGEPIASSPDDALHVFCQSELDALWMEDILISRTGITEG